MIPTAQAGTSDLHYATFLDGSVEETPFWGGVAVDTAGHAYVTGWAWSSDFQATPGAYQTNSDGREVFIVKMNPSGTERVYAALVGGTNTDAGGAIAVDTDGNAYVTGYTSSSDFPAAAGPGFDTSYSWDYDAFVIKLDADGTNLVYASYLGGGGRDWGYGIAVDENYNAYITGITGYDNFFPADVPGYDKSVGAFEDAFVVKVNASGTGLVYSTFLGGGDADGGSAIAVDENGNAYVTGWTWSSDMFPSGIPGYKSNLGGSIDAFVVKLNPAGTNLTYATYLGGDSNEDEGYDIAIDADGNVYVTGKTWANDFVPPGVSGYDTSYGGYIDAFVAKINVSGTGLAYATYLGGSNATDIGYGIAVDDLGNAYVTGVTYSSVDIIPPDVPGFDKEKDHGGDAFIIKLNNSGTGLEYASYLGAYWYDYGVAIAVDGNGGIYVVGRPGSTDFIPPGVAGYDTTYNGEGTFVVKLSTGPANVLYPDSTFAVECPFCNLRDTYNEIGGPINTNTGNYGYQATDLSIPTLSQPLRFERTYNSMPITGTVIYDRPLGYGWTHNYDLNLSLPDDPGGEPGMVILKAFHGSRLRFSDNGDGTYSPVPGIFATLARHGQAAPYHYVITTTNQNVYTFGILTSSIAIEPIYSTPPLSLTLSPDYALGAAPGAVFSVTHILSNTSGLTDTYDLSAASAGNWLAVAPVTATLGISEAMTVTALISVPQSYGREAVISATITAASQTTPTIVATAVTTLTLRGYRLLVHRDPQGNEVVFDYDSAGDLGQVADPTGQRWISFEHDSEGRLTSIEDHAGRQVSYGYDVYDNLTVMTDTRSLAWTYVYTSPPPYTDVPHLLHQVIDPDGRTVEKTFFDEQGRAIRQEDGLGNVVAEISYVSNTRLITENGKVYTDTYDVRGLLVNQTNAFGEEQDYDFDASFSRTFVEDGEGNETRYARTNLGLTLAITDALDNVTRFTYDANNNLETSTDARGYTTSYVYDSDNTLRQVINPPQVGGTKVYTYNSLGQVTEMQDERGYKTVYIYDPNTGDRTAVTDALNQTTTYEYDSLGQVITTTDPLGKVTVNEYDPAGNRVKVTENYLAGQPQNYQNEYNLITLYEYDGAGRQTVITDTLNRMSVNVYDQAGRLERSVQNYQDGTYNPAVPDEDIVTEYGYDAFGRQVSVTDTLGRETRTVYDAAGRVHKSIVNYEDGVYNSSAPDEDIVTEYVYDANGNIIETIELPGSAEERVTCTVYDALNRVERTVENCVTSDPATPGSYSSEPDEDLATRYVYDDVGNQVEVYDPLNRKTSYDYDALNRVITMTNPAGDATVYGYDAASNRIGMTDANEHTTTYQYDALNRVVTTTNHLNGQTLVRYDAVGNRTQVIDANSHAITYTYDSLYRLTQLTDAKNQVTSWSYDALGNKLSQEDAEEIVTRFEYDRLNRLITTTQNYVQGGPANFETNVKTISTYDGLGRRTALTDGRGKTTQYGYDALDRVILVTDPLNQPTHSSYDGRGNRIQIVNPKSEIVNLSYDGVDRLRLVEDPLGRQTEYRYNQAGERVAMIDAEGVETRYEYDDLGRLVKVIENYEDGDYEDENIPDEDVVTQYGYDPAGNRTVITNTLGYTTTYRYDELNRRIEQEDALGHVTEYGYDNVGNRTVITDALSPPVVTLFTYDAVNQLTHINYSDSTPDVTFTYDQVGNRKTMIDGTGTTVYIYDQLYRLAGVVDGANQTVSYGHDEAGNRTRLTYPDDKEVTYIYDDANRLDSVTADWLNGQFGYNYDEANRLTGLALPNGVTNVYDYDDAGRLTMLAHSTLTETVASYAYSLDNAGNRRVLTETLVTVDSLPGGAYLEADGLVVMEAEHGDRTSGATHTWLLQTSQSGYTGTSYLQPLPDLDQLYQTGEITGGPKADYLVNFTTPATYTLWLRGYPANAAGDSVYVEVGDEMVEVTGFGPGEWSWASLSLAEAPATVPITASGIYTISLWMREDGLRIVRLLLTTDTNYIPTGFGPAETTRLSTDLILTSTLTRTIVYTYDNLYRLTNADYTTGESYAYEYDPVGNRLKQIINGDTTDYLYDAANRLSQVDGQSYSFDNNGNLLTTGVMTNTFDAANRLTTSTRDGTIIQPLYNGVGDRVGQTVGTTTTHFALDVAGGLPEVIYTTEGNVYLHLPGVIVAESNTGETRYLLSDGLGSVRQAVDENGTVVAYSEFDPYGNPVENGSEPYGFTGEWWEDEVQLLHLRARWYTPYLNHFISPDAIVPEETNPQHWNRYSYVYNNHVRYTDPSGHCPWRVVGVIVALAAIDYAWTAYDAYQAIQVIYYRLREAIVCNGVVMYGYQCECCEGIVQPRVVEREAFKQMRSADFQSALLKISSATSSSLFFLRPSPGWQSYRYRQTHQPNPPL